MTMNKKIIFGLMLLSFLPLLSFSADDGKKSPAVDMKELALRFDAEAKPFFTVDRNTTFVKVDGGFTYLPANSIVPVLDGIMKVNGVFCSKAMSELAEASKIVEAAMKNYQSAAAELDDLKNKVDDAKGNVADLEDEITALDRRLADLKKEKNANTQKLSLDLGRKRNELTDAKRDFKKLDKDFDKKKEIPEELKKKADSVKAVLDTFLANQKKLAQVPKDEKKADDKKPVEQKLPAKQDDVPAPKFK